MSGGFERLFGDKWKARRAELLAFAEEVGIGKGGIKAAAARFGCSPQAAGKAARRAFRERADAAARADFERRFEKVFGGLREAQVRRCPSCGSPAPASEARRMADKLKRHGASGAATFMYKVAAAFEERR